MQNPFLVVRFVFFSLFAYLNLIILTLASWNIAAASSSRISVPGASIFAVYNSCMVFCFIGLGLAELVIPRAKTAMVKFECLWVAMSVLLQMAATISLTINGSTTMCQVNSPWEICASSSLLVPTAWLSSFTLLSYFCLLFVTVISHMPTYPTVWSATLYSVPWFSQPEHVSSGSENQSLAMSSRRYTRSTARIPTTNPSNSIASRTDAEENLDSRWSKSTDLEGASRTTTTKSRTSQNEEKPFRRGIDHPFTKRQGSSSSRASSNARSTPLPPRPLQVLTKGRRPGQTEASRYVEHIQESRALFRPGTSRTQFPHQVEDLDLPIPLPRLSEWIRADAIEGINVHTIPLHSP